MKKKFLLNGHAVNVAKLDAVMLVLIVAVGFAIWIATGE